MRAYDGPVKKRIVPLIILAATFAALSGCDDEDRATPHRPTVEATSPTAPPPTAITTPDDPFSFVAKAEFPSNVALYVETGCWRCDGPATGLWRIYKDDSGLVRQEILAARLPGTYRGAVASSDASTLAVSMCLGRCAACTECFPERQVIYLSHDGGSTFDPIGELTDPHANVAVVLSTRVLIQSATDYTMLPGGDPVVPPPGASGRLPFALSGNEIGWVTNQGNTALRADGSVVFTLPDDREIWLVSALSGNGHPSYVVYSSSRLGGRFVSFVSEGGVVRERELGTALLYAIKALESGPDEASPLILGNVLPDPSAASLSPSVIDIQSGQILRISDPFGGEQFQGGRNRIVTAKRGLVTEER